MKGLGVRDGSLELSNNDGHGYTTIEALKITDSFLHFVVSNKLLDTLIKYVAEGDVVEENAYILQLQEQYPGFTIFSKGLVLGKINHCWGDVNRRLSDDPRLLNSTECLKLSISIKSLYPAESIRVLSFGIHLIQDYFVHLNAPGKGDTGVSHGVNVLIDSDNDGIPDKFAGYFVDNLNWDCHSGRHDIGIDLYDTETTDLFCSTNWHYHEQRRNCWRFLAALHTTAAYMNAFASENCFMYEETISQGYVENGKTKMFINLLPKGI